MNKFDSDIFNADEFSIQLVSPDLRQQLIGIYHEEVENYLKQARAALAERDAAKLHQAAHSLKGVVGNYLGTRAFAAATALDSAARKEDLDAAAVRLAKCEKEVELLGEALLAYREENA